MIDGAAIAPNYEGNLYMKRARIHVNLPHQEHLHNHSAKVHLAYIPHPSFKMTSIKQYRLAKKPQVGEEKLLMSRNICVAVAAALFLVALLPHHLVDHSIKYALRGVAYIVGAGAYLSEMLMITDNFKHMHPFREMFMPYVFSILYVLMAVAYFFEM